MFQKLKKWIQPGSLDTVFLLIVFALLTVGIVMMFSASYVSASYKMHNPNYYFVRQIAYAGVGLVCMFLVSRIRLELFKRWSLYILAFCVLLLILVLINPITISDKEDFRRWLGIPGVITFQPSEVAKLGLVLFCARALSDRVKAQRKVGEQDYSIRICMGVTLLLCVLVILERHLSGTILMLGIGAVMLVLGGVKKKWIVFVLGAAVFGILLFLLLKEKLRSPAAR